MKTYKILKSAIAAAAVVAVSPQAFSYSHSDTSDTTGFVDIGRAQIEDHAISMATRSYCTLSCVGDPSIAVGAFQIENVSWGAAATPQEDTLTAIQVLDASGNAVSTTNATMNVWRSSAPSSGWGSFDLEAFAGSEITDFEFTSNLEGKIIGGWMQMRSDYTPFGASVLCQMFDFDNQVATSYEGDPLLGGADTCQITIDQVRGIQDPANPAAGNPAGWVATVDVNYISEFDYVTCDTSRACGASGAKAVPVPAFAAAALGLGLLGVTLVTGRRRKIK